MSNYANAKPSETLIALAREKVHTDRELAERIGIHPPTLTQMKRGKRPISPENVAALCEVAGLDQADAQRWLALIVIESAKDSEKAGVMRRAFLPLGAALLGLGVALSSGSIRNAEAASTAGQTAVNKTVIVHLEGPLYTLWIV